MSSYAIITPNLLSLDHAINPVYRVLYFPALNSDCALGPERTAVSSGSKESDGAEGENHEEVLELYM